MLRRKIPSLIVDFTAPYKDAAASLTSYLLREDDKGGYAEKGPWKDHGVSEEVDIDAKRVISLDESSDDDDYLVSVHLRFPSPWVRELFQRTQLWQLYKGEMFSATAKTTTCEAKYKVHPRIAEFWCTMTSPIYLLPIAVVYQCGGLFALPPTAHFALFSTFCTATASFMYHTCNTEFLSLMDVVLAFNTQLAFTICFIEDITRRGAGAEYFGDLSMSSGDWLLTSVASTALLFAVFLLSPWPQATPLIAFGSLLPPTCLMLFLSGVYSTLILLCAGTVSFVIDRLGIFPAHSLWHFFSAGGLYTCLAAALHTSEGCGIFSIPQTVDAL